MKRQCASIMTVGVILLSATVVFSAPLEKYRFLKISPQDHKAVMKTPGGELQIVGEGDVIAENATVVEVAEGRIVLEEGGETVIVRMGGGKQRIERYKKDVGRRKAKGTQIDAERANRI